MKRTPSPDENPFDVRDGQVWRDNHPRHVGSTITIDKLLLRKDGRWRAQGLRSDTGKRTTILLSRFNGDRNGYTDVTSEVRSAAIAAGFKPETLGIAGAEVSLPVPPLDSV